MKGNSFKTIFLIFFLWQNTSFGFFAKWFSNTDKECRGNSETPGSYLGCQDQYLRMTPYDELLAEQEIIINGEKAGIIIENANDDLKAMKKLSQKIIVQAETFSDQNFELRREVIKNENGPLEEQFKHSLNQLLVIDHKIDELNNIRCTRKKNVESTRNCNKNKSERIHAIMQLRHQKTASNPLLANSKIKTLINKSIKKHKAYHEEQTKKLNNCRRGKRGPVKRDIRNIELCKKEVHVKHPTKPIIAIDDDIYDKYLKKALDSQFKKTSRLLERHRKVIKEIDAVKPENIFDLRKKFYDDDPIATDYVLAGDTSSFTSEGFMCRISNEFDLNERNNLINSAALDIAIMAIPIGAPLIVSKAAVNTNRIIRLGRDGIRPKTVQAKSSALTMTAETTVKLIDTANLNQERLRCNQILETISLTGATAKAESDFRTEKYKNCVDTLRNSSINYVATFIGGTAASISSLKKFKDINNKKLQAVQSAYRVGFGEIGANGWVAKLGNYTKVQLAKKKEILRKAGFTENEIEELFAAKLL